MPQVLLGFMFLYIGVHFSSVFIVIFLQLFDNGI